MSSRKDNLRELLSAYLDGQVTEDEAREVEAALQRDPDLAAGLAALRGVRDLLGRLPKASAPAGLAERVLAQVERERLLSGPDEHAGPPASGWPGRLAAAAVILIAVGVGMFVVIKLSTPSWLEKVPTPVAVTGEQGRHRRKKEEIVAVAREVARRPTDLAAAPVKAGAEGTVGAIPRSAPASLAEEIPVTHFYMNTDNLALAQRDVERVLRSNGIQPVVLKRSEPWYARTTTRANVYYQTQAGPNRIEYEVPITREQLRRIIKQLNSIRAEQNVPQVPVPGIEGLPSEPEETYLARADLDSRADRLRAAKAKTWSPAEERAALPVRPGRSGKPAKADLSKSAPAAAPAPSSALGTGARPTGTGLGVTVGEADALAAANVARSAEDKDLHAAATATAGPTDDFWRFTCASEAVPGVPTGQGQPLIVARVEAEAPRSGRRVMAVGTAKGAVGAGGAAPAAPRAFGFESPGAKRRLVGATQPVSFAPRRLTQLRIILNCVARE